jgi:hypothetical protein
MYPLIQLKTTIPNSISRLALRPGLLLIPILLACFGLAPMAQAVGPDTDGSIAGANNGEGIGVLVSRTSGVWNTGTGFEALNHLTAGNQNTATGLRALFSDTNGGFNTATGVLSLFSNTSGFFNNATGAYSLAHNTDGSSNTANGYSALYFNTEGNQNTATGFAALYRNINGGLNTATGYGALYNNTTGSTNTANGRQALFDNTTGIRNTALGVNAGYNVTGSGNVCIGADVLGVAAIDNTTWIGNIYTTVQPVVGVDPDSVTVNSAGRLGRGAVSSRRYKHDIKLMGKASEALFKLKPVSFRYKEEFDSTQTLAFGLIAEEVAEVYPDLVGRNPEGQPESVRYEQINAMLLNEFLKEHRKVEQQERKMQELEATVAQLAATVKEQDSKIQRVSAQLEVNKTAPQIVLNNQ